MLPYERMDKEVLEDAPEMIHNITQPDFEQFVADSLGNPSDVPELIKGLAVESCIQVRHFIKLQCSWRH